MFHLSTLPSDQPRLVRDIASELKIPSPFLSKIVQVLARRGLILSQKGPGGGVTLGRPADQISLLEVVGVIDGLDLTRDCVLGLPDCGEGAPCPLHEHWGEIRDRIVTILEYQTIAGMGCELENLGRAL